MSLFVQCGYIFFYIFNREYKLYYSSPAPFFLSLCSEEPAHDCDCGCLHLLFIALAAGSDCHSASTVHEAGGHQTQQAVCWLCHGAQRPTWGKFQKARLPVKPLLKIRLIFSKYSFLQQVYYLCYHEDLSLNNTSFWAFLGLTTSVRLSIFS